MTKIKLALADDEALFLKGLSTILKSHKTIAVNLTATSGESLLAQLKEQKQPDIVLLDLRMKGMDGATTAEHLKKNHPALKIIVLSSHYREAFLGYMMKLGVNAFLPKNIAPGELVRVIQQVHLKGLFFTESQLQSLQKQLGSGKKMKSPKWSIHTELTRREEEVLQLICEQYTNAEIAEKLFISIRTVEGHRNNLLLKTGAKNTVGLVMFALFNHLIDWDQKLMQFGLTE